VAGVAFVAQGQPPAAGQPGQGSLDDPAVPAQPVAGLDALAGDAGGDAAATPSLRWRGETSHPWLDDDHLVHDHVSGAPAGPAFSGTLVHEGHTNAFLAFLYTRSIQIKELRNWPARLLHLLCLEDILALSDFKHRSDFR